MSSPTNGRWKAFPLAEFARRASDWDVIVSAGGYPPFLHSDFLAPALREFGTGREMLVVRDDEVGPSAMGLFVRKTAGVWETFQPSQLPLGAFVQRAGRQIDETIEALVSALPGFAVVAAITQQDPAIVARPPDSPRLRTMDYIETARVNVSGTFDDYWAARGKNLRTNVKRQRAKLADEGVAVHLGMVETRSAVPAAIVEYGRLETAGWKSGIGTAVATDNAQGRFYTSMFESFCARGAGRIYRYLFDDKVVAMDLCIEDAGVVVILKTAYDETYKNVSPASLMRHEYFRQIFDGGSIRRVEFYGKVMEWHRRWTDDVRILYHVNRYRSPWLRTTHEFLKRRPAKPDEAPPAGVTKTSV
jgi:CelD/BcsL family acetyltransferase involved in cellulose biosynthesis